MLALNHRGCTISTSDFRRVKQIKIIWTPTVNAKSMSTPRASSSHVILYHHTDLRLLFLPSGFSSRKDCLISVSRVAARTFWCIAATEDLVCVWLLSVTYTITQLLPVIKATLTFLGHFLLLLLFFLLRFLQQLSTCPPPLTTYLLVFIVKQS